MDNEQRFVQERRKSLNRRIVTLLLVDLILLFTVLVLSLFVNNRLTDALCIGLGVILMGILFLVAWYMGKRYTLFIIMLIW